MNKFTGIGRLTAEPNITTIANSNNDEIARFTLAITRNFKNRDGKYDSDFINCIAFKKTAEFVEKYFHKGMKAAVEGRIQTGSYTNKDNQKVYTTDVVIEAIEFVESKSATTTQPTTENASNDGFMTIPDNVDDTGLPF